MLRVNFPFWGSNTCSAFPVSTLYIEIFPSLDPEITYLLQGENATVHRSTGPNESKCFCSPVLESQKQRLESKELLAIAKLK